MTNKVGFIFPDDASVEQAVNWLLDNGVPQDDIVIIADSEEGSSAPAVQETADQVQFGLISGTGLIGAGGALTGLTASPGQSSGFGSPGTVSGSAMGTAAGVAAAAAVIGTSFHHSHQDFDWDAWDVKADQAEAVNEHLQNGGRFLGVDLKHASLESKTLQQTLIERFGARPRINLY